MKKSVAVFIGGKSAEHDVSIVSGLQVFEAIDRESYNPFIVYVNVEGRWYVGDSLRKKSNYIPSVSRNSDLKEVYLDTTHSNQGLLISTQKPFFRSSQKLFFDIAVPALHGSSGEDGSFQGLFDMLDIPYVGMRRLACAVFMDKPATKHFMKGLDIPTLPCVAIQRPESGFIISESQQSELENSLIFPCCVKPSHLGSSIGVEKVNSIAELVSVLPAIFQHDTSAIVETFVENLVEYNVSITAALGSDVTVSAIERPKSDKELLDFKEKYLSSSDGKLGVKGPGRQSEGMLSLTREINPILDEKLKAKLIDYSLKAFQAINGSGAPRIDYLSNSKTNEIWLNEVNACPGSFAYFLWEAADPEPVLFTELLNALIKEAEKINSMRVVTGEVVPVDARIFEKRGE